MLGSDHQAASQSRRAQTEEKRRDRQRNNLADPVKLSQSVTHFNDAVCMIWAGADAEEHLRFLCLHALGRARVEQKSVPAVLAIVQRYMAIFKTDEQAWKGTPGACKGTFKDLKPYFLRFMDAWEHASESEIIDAEPPDAGALRKLAEDMLDELPQEAASSSGAVPHGAVPHARAPVASAQAGSSGAALGVEEGPVDTLSGLGPVHPYDYEDPPSPAHTIGIEPFADLLDYEEEPTDLEPQIVAFVGLCTFVPSWPTAPVFRPPESGSVSDSSAVASSASSPSSSPKAPSRALSTPARPALAASEAVCSHPDCSRPRFVDTTGETLDYCGKTCATLHRRSLGLPTPRVARPLKCKLEGCTKDASCDAETGRVYLFCSPAHHQMAVDIGKHERPVCAVGGSSALNSRKCAQPGCPFERHEGHEYCSKDCAMAALLEGCAIAPSTRRPRRIVD